MELTLVQVHTVRESFLVNTNFITTLLKRGTTAAILINVSYVMTYKRSALKGIKVAK